jgi:hypothetical protein
MINYVPFLKTKTNEFAAVKELTPDIAQNIIPFFDIKRKEKDNYTEEEFKRVISVIKRKYELNLKNIHNFYLDDFDCNNDLFIDGKQSYGYVINQLSSLLFIPVIGIDRSDERNSIVFENRNLIQSDTVALRVKTEDLTAGYTDIVELKKTAEQYFHSIELIIDNKVLVRDNSYYCQTISNFLVKFQCLFSKVVITGSIITDSIKKLLSTDTTKDLPRNELLLYHDLNEKFSDLYFGDYTIVSPYYSEIDIEPQFFQKVTAPKIFYIYNYTQHIQRGIQLEKTKEDQYKKLCSQLSKEMFFRGEQYSSGDSFIVNAHTYPKRITPGTILKPTINAHITYMYKDFQL